MNPEIVLSGGTSAAANGTPAWSLNQNYADNIRRVGGIPLLAVNNDCAEEYADLADGLLLSGGKDVAPALYGEELKYDFVITDPLRDDLEWKLIKAFVDRKKPIFGICRGVHVPAYEKMDNVEIVAACDIMRPPYERIVHSVALLPGSPLAALLGRAELGVNSYHHQALKDLGKDLTAVAWSDANGHSIVEAVEHVSLPIWAVQWHPERMTGPVTNPENCVDSLPIFQYFMDQCRK